MNVKTPPHPSTPFINRIKSDGLLLFVSAIWGSGFVAQRVASVSMGNFTFNGVRFTLAAIFLLVVIRFRFKVTRHQLGWVLLAGFLLFCASTFQQIGIKTTTAANAGFITGLYVIMVPIALAIFGRQRILWSTWVGAIVAVVGTLLLSSGGKFQPAIGDLYELIGAFFWAAHLIVIGKISKEMDNLVFTIGQFAVSGMLNLASAAVFEIHTAPVSAAWLAVLYSAIFPVGLGFTLQVVGQKHAPTTDAAIIFSMEAVFGALSGFLFLHEGLQPLQILGCFLILAAIIVAQIRPGADLTPVETVKPADNADLLASLPPNE